MWISGSEGHLADASSCSGLPCSSSFLPWHNEWECFDQPWHARVEIHEPWLWCTANEWALQVFCKSVLYTVDTWCMKDALENQILWWFLFFPLGPPAYSFSEYTLHKECVIAPAAVWSLGILMFELVCGISPFTSEKENTDGHLRFISGLSYCKKMQMIYFCFHCSHSYFCVITSHTACYELTMWCLDKFREQCARFKKILSSQWFKENAQDTVKVRHLEWNKSNYMGATRARL